MAPFRTRSPARLVRLCLPIVALLLCGSLAAQDQTPVTVRSVAELALYPTSSAPATAVSLNDAQLSAELVGVVETVPVRVGDRVAEGAVLAELDCASYTFKSAQIKAQLDAAKARRELADFQLGQVQKMQKENFASVEEIMRRKSAARETDAQVAQLQASLQEAENLVKKCELRAPFEGVVIERNASPGQLANPGMPLLRLVDSNDLEVSAQIQEQDLARLRAARQVVFATASRQFPVTLRAVVPVVDTRLRSYEARFVFSDEKAAPGEAGRIQWRATTPHLPSDVLARRDGALGVFTAEKGRARFHPLPGAREGYPAPVSLPPDAQVILEGRFNVTDGHAVDVVER